jgi:hypothetical protein
MDDARGGCPLAVWEAVTWLSAALDTICVDAGACAVGTSGLSSSSTEHAGFVLARRTGSRALLDRFSFLHSAIDLHGRTGCPEAWRNKW